eukprot:4764346-Amphidinium_carterae.1
MFAQHSQRPFKNPTTESRPFYEEQPPCDEETTLDARSFQLGLNLLRLPSSFILGHAGESYACVGEQQRRKCRLP